MLNYEHCNVMLINILIVEFILTNFQIITNYSFYFINECIKENIPFIFFNFYFIFILSMSLFFHKFYFFKTYGTYVITILFFTYILLIYLM